MASGDQGHGEDARRKVIVTRYYRPYEIGVDVEPFRTYSNNMTNTMQLTWNRPELLAHGMVTAAKDNAIALVREAGLEVTNETLGDMCADAIAHFAQASSVTAAAWIRAYQSVRLALGCAS